VGLQSISVDIGSDTVAIYKSGFGIEKDAYDGDRNYKEYLMDVLRNANRKSSGDD
jgi:hypothetical protein